MGLNTTTQKSSLQLAVRNGCDVESEAHTYERQGRVRPKHTFYMKRLVTSPISHVGTGEGCSSLVLLKALHSLLSVTNCAGVKICFSERADKIAALNTRTVETAKLWSLNKNKRKSLKFPIETEAESIFLSIHQVQKIKTSSSRPDVLCCSPVYSEGVRVCLWLLLLISAASSHTFQFNYTTHQRGSVNDFCCLLFS